MARKCRTKIGTRYYSENQIDRLKFLSEERDRLRKGKLGKEFTSENDVNAEISKVVNYGIEDVRDSMGNPVLDDIFVYQSDPNTRSVKTSILDRLRIKSYALNEIGVSPKEIWDVYKDKLQAQGISFEEVIYQLRQSPDVPKLNRNTKNSYRTYDTTDNKTMLRDVRNKLLKFKEAFFTREGTTNETFKKVYEMRVNMSDRIKSHSIKTNIKLNRLRKLLDNNNVSEDVRGQLFDSIKDKTIGKVSIPNVTPEVETTINNLINDARLDIDLMTVELQNLGVLDDVRLDILQNNKGEYLTKAYEAYINPDWAKKVQGMPGVLTAASPIIEKILDSEIKSLEKTVDKLNKKLADPNIKQSDREKYERQKDLNEGLLQTQQSNKNDITSYMIGYLESLNKRKEGVLDDNGIIRDKIFKKSQELSPELRAFLGEIKDPIDAISITIGRMAQSYVTRKFQKDLASFLIDKNMYYFGEYNSEAASKGWVKMELNESGKEILSQSFGGAKEIWVPQQIKNVIDTYREIVINKDAEGVHDTNPLDALRVMGGSYKKIATVYNIGGQFVNYVGAASIEFGNGKFLKPGFHKDLLDSHINLFIEALATIDKSKFPGLKKIGKKIDYKPTEEWQEISRIATEAGLKSASVNAEIIDELLNKKNNAVLKKINEIIIEGIEKGKDRGAITSSVAKFLESTGGVLSGIDSFLTTTYKLGDEIFKVAHLKNELDLYARAAGFKDFKSITDPAIKDKVATKAKYNTRGEIPNYNEVWGIVKALKRNPLIGAFPSFKYELLRSNIFSVKLMAEQLASKNPVLVKEGLRKAIGKGLIVSAGIFGSRALSNMFSGMEDDENEFWKEQGLPTYARSGALVSTDKPSIIKVINMNAYAPINSVNDIILPYQDYVDGRNESFVLPLLGNIVGEYIGEEITIETLKGLGFGKDQWGADVYSESNDFAQRIKEGTEFVAKNFPGAPGAIYNYNKINDKLENTIQAISREYNRDPNSDKLKVLIEKKNILEEKLGSKFQSSMGLRNMSFDKNEILTYQFMDKAKEMDSKNLKRLYEDKYKSGGYTEESAEDAKAYVEGIYHKNLKKLRAFYYDVSERTTATDPEGILAGKYKFSGLSENYTGDYPLFNKAEIAYITGEVSKEKLPPISLSVAKRVEASYK